MHMVIRIKRVHEEGRKRVVVLLVSLGVIIIVAVVSWVILSGRAVVSFTKPHQVVTTSSKICSDTLINSYNKAIKAVDQAAYTTGLQTVHSQIGVLSDSSSDPNCLYMEYTYYFNQQNYTQAQQTLDGLKTLATQGRYATNQLANVQDLDIMQQILTASKTAPKSPPASNAPAGRG